MLACFHKVIGAVRAAFETWTHRAVPSQNRSRNAHVFAPEQCEDRHMMAGVGISGVVGPNTINTQAHTTFVPALYTSVLNRQPDYVGLTVYNNMFLAGVSPTDVANSFWNSGEHRALQVDAFYQTYLNRAADPAGRANWINQMLAGVSEEEVSTAFFLCDEYQAQNPSNSAFVASIYQDVLGRTADPDGLAAWSGALTAGATKADVVTAFINSHERHLKIVDAYYQHYLLRPADPFGLDSWVALLDAGTVEDETVAVAILNSGEFQAAHVLFGPAGSVVVT